MLKKNRNRHPRVGWKNKVEPANTEFKSRERLQKNGMHPDKGGGSQMLQNYLSNTGEKGRQRRKFTRKLRVCLV